MTPTTPEPEPAAPSPTVAAVPVAPSGPRKLPIVVAFAQGFFCLVLGLWPVVGFQSFLAVTGQKPDHWSLTLVGSLLAGIGISMLISAVRRDIAFEVYTIGIVTALSLAVTDVIFVFERSIPFKYLLDAVAETLFVTLWVFAIRDLRRARRIPESSAPPGNGTSTGGPYGTG